MKTFLFLFISVFIFVVLITMVYVVGEITGARFHNVIDFISGIAIGICCLYPADKIADKLMEDK